MNLGDRGSNPFMTTNFKFSIYGKENNLYTNFD